ncbi:MAG: hypothetical protein JM57_11280 [Comamonadaceae bacterium BICA1-1]|nr:MAG: hypothetical protein JM57_11280 [Comamonadaceae bacterium BICA1-1]
MKKTLIALAALAATGATLAQSSVTIYGRMDLGAASTDVSQVGVTPAGVGAGTAGSSDTFSLAGAEGERTGSRLGFRGTEDLGGGLRAGFVYEIGINPDRAAVGNAQTRLANLSLTGGFGTVVIGTFDNAFFTARTISPATIGAPGGFFTQAHGAPGTERVDFRSQNAIAYVSPAFSGFTFSVGTANEESSTFNAAGVELTRTESQGVLLGLRYAQGPVVVQFAFADVDGSTRGRTLAADNGDLGLRNWVLGASYALPQVVLSFVYEDARSTTTAVAATASNVREFNAWELGARFPMGAFAPYITFGEGEITNRSTAGVVTATDTSAWQIGTTYNLSTRTWVYAAFGEIELSRPGFSRKTDGYRLGLVHTF